MQSTIYRMYGAEFSLYSGELKSYLRKKGLDFEEIQPSLLTYKRFIVPHIDVGCRAVDGNPLAWVRMIRTPMRV